MIDNDIFAIRKKRKHGNYLMLFSFWINEKTEKFLGTKESCLNLTNHECTYHVCHGLISEESIPGIVEVT